MAQLVCHSDYGAGDEYVSRLSDRLAFFYLEIVALHIPYATPSKSSYKSHVLPFKYITLYIS